MYPKVIESYSACGVNVGKIVNRILHFAPQRSINGLNAVRILDNDISQQGFANYSKETAEIRLFVTPLICWLPWILKRSYLLPYLIVGLALGHEIDHHVNRDKEKIDKEEAAESNALKYVYPSLGIFKPLVRLISLFWKKGKK